MGSAVFHPESSRVARLASGGRHGLAQSVFQVGGNTGSAIGPLLAAFIVLPHGQRAVAWFCSAGPAGIRRLMRVSRWYKDRASALQTAREACADATCLPPRSGLRRSRFLIAAGLFQVFLSGQPHQLLHLLPDQPLSCGGAQRADSPVPVPGRGRCRHPDRRPHRRPHRPQDW